MQPVAWHEHTVDAGDVQLHVREAGDPTAPTVVCVHGYPDAGAVWDDVAARLVERHHVVAYDVRGMGRSTMPTGTDPFRLDRLADDLYAVIEATSPHGAAHVVAHDWGSIQAWEAVTDTARNHRIASFTTMSGPCLDHIGFAVREQLRRPTARGLGRLVRQAAKSTYIVFLHTPGISTGIWRRGGDRSFQRFLSRVEGVPIDDRHPTLAADGETGVHLYRANIRPRLRRPCERHTDVPVLLVTLARDRYVTPILLDGLERWASSLTRRTLDARHWAPRTHPDEVATLVADHVAAHPAGALAG